MSTIVLVHGAFADASGWNDVITRLQRDGHTVYAPANPLRGLESDAAYVRSFSPGAPTAPPPAQPAPEDAGPN